MLKYSFDGDQISLLQSVVPETFSLEIGEHDHYFLVREDVKNGYFTVRLTVSVDVFFGEYLILDYVYMCSETDLHKKEIIFIQHLESPILIIPIPIQ